MSKIDFIADIIAETRRMKARGIQSCAVVMSERIYNRITGGPRISRKGNAHQRRKEVRRKARSMALRDRIREYSVIDGTRANQPEGF